MVADAINIKDEGAEESEEVADATVADAAAEEEDEEIRSKIKSPNNTSIPNGAKYIPSRNFKTMALITNGMQLFRIWWEETLQDAYL